jgi:hypothetical protein
MVEPVAEQEELSRKATPGPALPSLSVTFHERVTFYITGAASSVGKA